MKKRTITLIAIASIVMMGLLIVAPAASATPTPYPYPPDLLSKYEYTIWTFHGHIGDHSRFVMKASVYTTTSTIIGPIRVYYVIIDCCV